MREVVLAAVFGLLTAGRLSSQTVNTQSSFSDKIELTDSQSVIAGALSDTEDLIKQNLILQEQVRSISEALVVSKSEAETATVENRELKARIEALGLNALGTDRAKLEQRLIKAVNDLGITQTQLAECRSSLASLSEAIVTLLKTSEGISPDARLAVEAELRGVENATGASGESSARAEPMASSLTSARVISLKPELGLLIGNIGSNESVKIGMPFRVYDGQTPVALVRVVDVRERLFGALIQETLSDTTPVKIGHRLKVAAN